MDPVVVIGGGVHGRWITAKLQQMPGVDVVLLEKFYDGHTHGSSHDGERIIRPPMYEGPNYMDWARYSAQGFAAMSKRTGHDIVFNRGRGFHAVQLGQSIEDLIRMPDASAWLLARTQLCNRFGVQNTAMNGKELNAFSNGFFGLEDSDILLLQPDMGVINMYAAMAAPLDVARAEGAQIRFNANVQSIDYHRKQVKMRNGDTIQASKIVLAANGSNNLLLDASFKLDYRIEQRDVAFFRITRPWQADQMPPAFISQTRNGTFYGMYSHGLSAPNNSVLPPYGYMKVGIHDFCSAELKPGEECHPVNMAGVFSLSNFAAQHLPHVDPEPAWVVSCKYSMTELPGLPPEVDGHFRVDIHPNYPDVLIWMVDNGHGAKFAGYSGEIAAEKLFGVPSGVNTEMFAVSMRADQVRRSGPSFH